LSEVRLDPYISELLYSHDCVIVPGLGGFVTHARGAFLNPAQHTFAPPAKRLAFNASLRMGDGVLAHAISRAQQITYHEALQLIQTFVDDVVQRLVAGETILIDKVGSLVYDNERNLQFEPEPSENYLKSSFGLSLVHSPAIRRDEKGGKSERQRPAKKVVKLKTRSRWRLLELVPAAAVLALLAFNPKVTRDLNASLSSLNPFHSFSINNSSEAPAAVVVTPSTEIQEVTTEEIPANAIENYSTPAEDPAVETIADTTHVVNSAAVQSTQQIVPGTFQVIGGCFREMQNAENFVRQASDAGFNAEISGQTRGGLHIVSLYTGNDLNEAQNLLTEVRASLEQGAWIKSN
jgi:hypothetical protein